MSPADAEVPRGWSAGVAAARLFGREEDRVRSPGGPLSELDCGGACTKGWRVCLANKLGWVRFPSSPLRELGCSSNRRTPASHVGNRGANPRRSTAAPVVKRTSSLASNEAFQVRPLVGVLRDSPVVQLAGHPLDMGEIGGSTPPGTTDERLGGLPDWGRGPVGSRLSTHTALRVRLPLLPLARMLQGCAPGRAGGLQNRGTGFESLRPC